MRQLPARDVTMLSQLKERDYGLYLSALLAPGDKCRIIAALHGFFLDLEKIMLFVAEPGLAQIRYQWWRETIGAFDEPVRSGHPVADALDQACAAGAFRAEGLMAMIDAFDRGIHSDPQNGGVELSGADACREMFELCLECLDAGQFGNMETVCAEAGAAYAGMRRLKNWQVYSAATMRQMAGKNPEVLTLNRVCNDIAQNYKQATAGINSIGNRSVAAAFLPLAVMPLYLKKIAQIPDFPQAGTIALSPLKTFWYTRRAARRGTFKALNESFSR